MTITIELSDGVLQLYNAKKPNTSRIDFLPAAFRENAPAANRSTYFDNYTQVDENHHFRNALRGHPLIGTETTVPNGCVGVVLQETRPPLMEDADRVLRVTETFDAFTYWNYDKTPSNGDAYKQALQMLAVSNALSQSVSTDDVEDEIRNHIE